MRQTLSFSTRQAALLRQTLASRLMLVAKPLSLIRRPLPFVQQATLYGERHLAVPAVQ